MRADMHNRDVRAELVDATLPHIEQLAEMVRRAAMIGATAPTDAHYVISKLWEGFGSLVAALATLGVDADDLGRELLEHAQLGCEAHSGIVGRGYHTL